MAYVRKRTTKAGTVSTALVESYRDDQGRPRQRLIANLHGESDPLRALAEITMMWDGLQAELEELVEMPPGNNQSSEQRADWLRRFEKIERNWPLSERTGLQLRSIAPRQKTNSRPRSTYTSKRAATSCLLYGGPSSPSSNARLRCGA
jgi:hypothetical protein